jgi:RNA polymerase sigma-70 factor (ECF subfamily)
MGDDVEKEIAVQAIATHLRPLPSPADQLDRLYREHANLVLRTAYRVTGSNADAEDVLQTVFLRLARRDDMDALEPNPAAYLRRAAVNASLDLVRARKRAPHVALDEVGARESGTSLQTIQEDRELQDRVREAVAKLNPRAAEMFVLRYFEGYDNGEIAELLGMSKMVVPVLLHRARARVREELGRYLGRDDNEANA